MKPSAHQDTPETRPSILAIGASTGGPRAILSIMASLAPPLPLPLVIVQHIEHGFDKGFCAWLTLESGHTALLAAEGMSPSAGTLYIAPTDRHLTTVSGILRLRDDPPVFNQKPSIDVLFSSLAKDYGPGVLAILLSGMGHDGAAGCHNIHDAGGMTIVQDPRDAIAYGMPRAAIETGGAGLVLPLTEIASAIAARTGARSR